MLSNIAAGLAGALGGITPQAVSQRRRVPAERVLDVEKATGATAHDYIAIAGHFGNLGTLDNTNFPNMGTYVGIGGAGVEVPRGCRPVGT
jgi:hypothetical protein